MNNKWAKKIGILFLLAGLIKSTPAQAGSLMGRVIINTGTVECKGAASAEWTNNTGTTLYIKKASIWIADNQNTKISAELNRTSDNSILTSIYWNNFGANSGQGQHTENYNSDYFTLENGDKLQLNYICTNFNRGVINNISARIWYTVVFP